MHGGVEVVGPLGRCEQFFLEVGSMARWIDDVLSIVLQQGRSSKANKITDNQFPVCHKHHLKLLMPIGDLDKVSSFPAGKFTLVADSVGRLVASWRVGTLLFVPSFQDITIETLNHYTKDAAAEFCKSSSMLTQDSVNEAIREVNLRIGCVDSEADHLNFTVKRNSKVGNRWSIFTLQRSSGRAPSTVEVCRSCLVMPKGSVPARTNKVCEVAIAEAKECRQRLQSMFENAGADTADTLR